MAKWMSFWIDSLTFCDWVNSKEDWIKIVKEKFAGRIEKPIQYKSCSMSKYPDFGVGVRYTSSPTLGEWAKEHGIDLTI